MLCHDMVGGVYEHYRMVIVDEVVTDYVLDLAIRISMDGVMIQSVTLAINKIEEKNRIRRPLPFSSRTLSAPSQHHLPGGPLSLNIAPADRADPDPFHPLGVLLQISRKI
jgi:hypothetical protein